METIEIAKLAKKKREDFFEEKKLTPIVNKKSKGNVYISGFIHGFRAAEALFKTGNVPNEK